MNCAYVTEVDPILKDRIPLLVTALNALDFGGSFRRDDAIRADLLQRIQDRVEQLHREACRKGAVAGSAEGERALGRIQALDEIRSFLASPTLFKEPGGPEGGSCG